MVKQYFNKNKPEVIESNIQSTKPTNEASNGSNEEVNISNEPSNIQ